MPNPDNTFRNTSLVTKFAIKELMNSLVLAQKVDRQIDEERIFSGKVGATTFVRRPVYFTASDGEEIQSGETEAIEEATVPVVLQYRKKVVFSLSAQELALNVQDAREQYIKPAMQEMAQQMDSSIGAEYKNIYNFVGTPGITPATFLSIGAAGALMSSLGVPMMGRNAFYEPYASLALADGLKGVFPNKIATSAIEEAKVGAGRYANFDVYESQNIKPHTVGVNTGTPLVNGADQNVTYLASGNSWSQTLNVDGWTNSVTGILKAGDVFTIEGVFAVNRKSRETTGQLALFTVLTDADSDGSGESQLTISPPMIIDGPYQTVTGAPADNAAITVKTGTGGTTHPQNLLFHPNAITMAMARLDAPDPKDGVNSAVEQYKGFTMRATRQYDVYSDKTVFRFDALWGVKTQNPDFACRHTG